MNFLRSGFADAAEQHPHGGGADDGILDQENPLSFQHLAQRCVLGFRFFAAAIAPFNESAARVAVADQSFPRRNSELVGHRVGGGFARVGDGDDDGVFIQRHAATLRLQPGQLFAQVDRPDPMLLV